MNKKYILAIGATAVMNIVAYFSSLPFLFYVSVYFAEALGAREIEQFFLSQKISIAWIFLGIPLIFAYITRSFCKKYSFYPNYLILFLVGALSIYGAGATTNLIKKYTYQKSVTSATDIVQINIEPGKVIKIASGESGKLTPKIFGQEIIWYEQIQKVPIDAQNVWANIIFDLKTKKITQLSDPDYLLSHNASFPDVASIDAKDVNSSVKDSIWTYNFNVQDPKILDDNTTLVVSVSDKYILFMRPGTDDTQLFFIYDRALKSEQPLILDMPHPSLSPNTFLKFVISGDYIVFSLDGYTTSKERYVATYKYVIPQKKLVQLPLPTAPIGDEFYPLQSFDNNSILFANREDSRLHKELSRDSFLVLNTIRDEFEQLSLSKGKMPTGERYFFNSVRSEQGKEILINVFDLFTQKNLQIARHACVGEFCSNHSFMGSDVKGNIIVWSYSGAKETDVFLYIFPQE